MDYKKAYAKLVGAISDAIDLLEQKHLTGKAIEVLSLSLTECEDTYINSYTGEGQNPACTGLG